LVILERGLWTGCACIGLKLSTRITSSLDYRHELPVPSLGKFLKLAIFYTFYLNPKDVTWNMVYNLITLFFCLYLSLSPSLGVCIYYYKY
jgi:hypothetical protein